MSTTARTPPLAAPSGPDALLGRLCPRAGLAALVYVDVRHMRAINRLIEPAAANRLLQQLLQQLRGWAGREGVAERLWSNEFIGMKPIDHAQAAHDEAHRLRDRLAELRYATPFGDNALAVAVGLTLARPRGNVRQLLAEAGEACLVAKQRGLNQVVAYSSSTAPAPAEVVSSASVAEFRRLRRDGRLRLFPQPIMDIRGELPRLRKAEFLTRMEGDSGEIRPLPGGMVASLEHFGLVGELDAFSAEALFDWLERYAHLMPQLDSVSINLSGHSMEDGAFMARLLREVRSLRPPHGKLCLEITESAAIHHLEQAAETIAAFRASGCRFSLDDFGSGLCSFGYLQSLPVDEVKIDGRFLRDLTGDPVSVEIVRAIHQVARATGKRTVAEFVDSERKLALLRGIGVDYAQGWLFHPAVSPERFEQLLDDGRPPILF